MRNLMGILGCILVLGLVSCADHYYLLKPRTPAVVQCLSACKQHFESCREKCTNNCRICRAKSNLSRDVRYHRFAQQQKLQGMAINRDEDAYKDPLRCLKITCNCYADLDVCNQGCTGMVRKRLIANPLPDCV